MNRRHDIDALRVIAFTLLILYHTGMLYVAPVAMWGFPLKSLHLSTDLQYPMLFLNRWRMELLFVISGICTRILLDRDGGHIGRTLWQRSLRLQWPLLFGMAVVVPCQPYLQAVQDGLVAPGYWRYWSQYYFIHGPSQAGLTWAHLWYLAYLWCYTVLVLAAWALARRWVRDRPGRPSIRLGPWFWLLVPALPLIGYGAWLQPQFAETHALIDDWYAHAIYLTMFIYGCLIGTRHRIWQALLRWRWISLRLALACFGPYLWLDKFADRNYWHHISPQVTFSVHWLWLSLHYIYTWSAICALLGWSRQLLDRPFRWLPYAREAVFPWYVLHQSVLLVVAYAVIPRHLGPLAEPAVILALTILGCAVIHELAIRRSRLLRPCFGLPPRRPTAARSMAARDAGQT